MIKITEEQVTELKKHFQKTIPDFFGNNLKETKLNEFVAKSLGYKNWNTLNGLIKTPKASRDLELIFNFCQGGEYGMNAFGIVYLSKETIIEIINKSKLIEDEYISLDIDNITLLENIQTSNKKLNNQLGKSDYFVLEESAEDIIKNFNNIDDEIRSEYPEVKLIKSGKDINLYFRTQAKYVNDPFFTNDSITIKELEKLIK